GGLWHLPFALLLPDCMHACAVGGFTNWSRIDGSEVGVGSCAWRRALILVHDRTSTGTCWRPASAGILLDLSISSSRSLRRSCAHRMRASSSLTGASLKKLAWSAGRRKGTSVGTDGNTAGMDRKRTGASAKP